MKACVISVRAECSSSSASMGAMAAATELASLASTVICSETLPSARVTGTSVAWPAVTVTSFFSAVLKPASSTWTVYLPAGRLAKEYLPLLSETAFWIALVASFLTRMSAPGRATPRGSNTVPEMVALDCACRDGVARIANTGSASMAPAIRRAQQSIGVGFIGIPFVEARSLGFGD